MSETSKGKIVRKYSKTLVTLSDAPRRAKVELDAEGSLHGHAVSAPIAKRIQNLYYHKPVEQHPMIVKRYGRGNSDTAAMATSRSSGNTSRAYKSVDEQPDTGQVYIRLGGGEELVFNDDLDALELSPTTLEPPEIQPSSLPRGRDNEKLVHDFSTKRRSVSLPRPNTETLTLHSDVEYPEHPNCDMEFENESESDMLQNESKSDMHQNGVLLLHNGTTEPQNESSTDDVLENTDRGIYNSSDDSANDTTKRTRTSLYTSNIRRTASQSPSLKKIDRYRASLRRRKAEKRCKSEPHVGEQDFYLRDTDSDISKADSSDKIDMDTSKHTNNTENEVKSSDEVNKPDVPKFKPRLYTPRVGARPTSNLVRPTRTTNITRSSSLSSLYRCNSLDDIPKGIAKSKISAIQKRVDDEKIPSHSGLGSPRHHSPTPKTVISPGGRVTSPDSVTSPRNIVSQRMAPHRSVTPMFFGGVPVAEPDGEPRAPPRRSRNRNTSKTVSSVNSTFNPFSYTAPKPTQQIKTNANASGTATLPDLVARNLKRFAPDPIGDRHSYNSRDSPEIGLKRPSGNPPFPPNNEKSIKRSVVEPRPPPTKRPSSVPPSLSGQDMESTCPPPVVPPPRKKTVAPKAPSVKLGVASIKRKAKGPAPLPPGGRQSTGDTTSSTSTDDASSSGDSLSIHSAEGIIAMETSDSGSSSEPVEIKDTNQPIKIEDDPPMRDSDDEYLDSDQPFKFTGLDLDDFAEMPVLILEGVTNSSSCDYDDDNETNDDSEIISVDVNMNNEDTSSDVLNTSGNSETDSVTTVVERDPIYIDMSRSSSMTDEIVMDSDYVTMDSVESGGNTVLNEQLNSSYINANIMDPESIIPVPTHFEDSPNTTITEAPTEFPDEFDDCPIYSTIERGVTFPRRVSTSSGQYSSQSKLEKSDSGDTLDSFAESMDSGISGQASESQALEEDTDDTLVDRNKCTADFSSSEDTLDDLDTYEPLYETIDNIQKVHDGVASRPRELALLMKHAGTTDGQHERKEVKVASTTRKLSDQSPLSPLSPMDNSQKVKSKSKKKNKKSRKKDRSPSPTKRDKTPSTDRVSSDEDLLNERRKRAMSPGAMARDFVVKIIRGRPNSPKDKSEKVLSPLDSSGRKSPFSLKKVSTSPVITKSVTYLPNEFDRIPGFVKRKQSSPAIFHIDFDNRPAQPPPCIQCENNNGDHSTHTHTGFNVNRYAGDTSKSSSDSKPPFERASKSMGDLYEAMRCKMDNINTRVIHEDPETSTESLKPATSKRTLPLIPMKKAVPILVKVIGKDEEMECQHPSCTSEERHAVKVCHHGDCQEKNNQQPLMLCQTCDTNVHTDPEYSGHMRFDVFRKGNMNRNSSLRSLPGLSQSDDEGGGPENDNEIKKSTKLKRKKQMPKRHHTTDGNHAEDSIEHSHSTSLNVDAFIRPLASDDDNSDDEYEDDNNGNVTNGPLEVVSEDFCDSDEILDTVKADTRLLKENIHSEMPDISESRLTNGHEDKIYFEQSHESAQNKSAFSEDSSEEPLSSILQSSPFSKDTVDGSDQLLLQQDNVQLDDIFGEDVDGTGRSKSYKVDTPLSEQNEQQGQKLDVTSSRQQTTPTTPKTPPGVPDLLKKYSMGGEYFTLKLDVLEERDVYEIVAAEKGVSLKGAVRGCLERRGINVNAVDIFLASSNTPLPLIADCYMLGGNHLHVKAKENNEQASQGRSYRSPSTTSLANGKQPKPATVKDKTPKQATSQRGKKSEDSGISSDVSPAGTFTQQDSAKYKELVKQQTKFGKFFSPFGKGQQEKHEYLLHQLENYSTNGLPPMPSLLVMGSTQYDDALFDIESHWSKIVGVEPSDLTKKQKDQQEAIWELVHTEVQYIRKLQVVIDLFYCCLMDLQNDGLLCEIKTEEVFSNIMEVCHCSQAFWVNHMCQIVHHSRRTHNLLDPSFLTEGFMKFDEIFHPYAKYCLEQKGCSEYIKNNVHDNELFRIFIQWAEAQKQCKRLKLQDLVISPMQRLTKYKLLLKAILKKTEKETQRNSDLIQMVDKVDRFVLQVNTVMHQRAEHERLSMIIDRIEAYDVIDTQNDEVQKLMTDFCKLDLTCPVPGCGPQQRRHLLLEGGLKFRDSVSKMDVYCFLFTDMLLITKPNRRGDKVKVTKPPMRLDKCVVHMLRDGVSFALLYLNEYHMATAVHTFHGEAAKVWVDHIRRAQDAYKSLRKSAVERSERRMYWEMFYEENYEDELAVINSRPHAGDSVERQDSTGSLDTCNSHDSVPRSVSHNAIRYNTDSEQKRGLRISASLDENAMYNTIRENVQRCDSEPSRTQMLSLPRQGATDYNISDNSPNGSPALMRTANDKYVTRKQRVRAETRRTDSQSSGSGATVSRSHSGSRYKTLPHETVPEEQVRNSRLNQRRISRDKRYHTADAIEDIRKETRDASIQKRMSWNLGTGMDINIDENRQSYLRTKTISSDSLRSMPSSSGVSSTGSLHLSPESEICEEEYEDDGEPDCAMLNAPGKSPHVHFNDQQSDGSSTNESSVTITENNEDSDSDSQLKSRNNYCKSLPNISSMNIRDVQDGVGTAEVRQESSSKRKLTHGDLLRMKKQLLLNSTLEASEV